MANYFTLDTQNAIIAYNKETNPTIKNKIFKDGIQSAFYKLTEFQVNKYQAYRIAEGFESAQHLVINHLLKNIHKYDVNIAKAFSFFTFITNTFIWNELKKAQKKTVIHTELTTIKDFTQNDDEYEDHKRRELFTQIVEYFDENLYNLFDNKQEILVVEAWLVLLMRYQNLEIFNKKALYLQVRELCRLEKSTIVTKVVFKMKTIFKHLLEKSKKEGYFDMTYIPDVNKLIKIKK